MNIISVNYHYFRENSTGNGIYPINKSKLLKQIDLLAQSYEFATQELVVSGNYPNANKDFCLLTFDDGLKEQINAFDILHGIGVPCVFYVTTDAIEYKKAIDVHKIHYVRSRLSDTEVISLISDDVDLSSYEFDEYILEKQYRYDDSGAKKLKYLLNFILDRQKKEELIDKIFSDLVTSESDFCKDLYMDQGDILKLHKAGALGTHSASHRALGTLELTDAKDDITRSVDFLRRVTGENVPSISYPYGGPTAVPTIDKTFYENLGLKFGLTMFRGVNSLPLEDSFLIKRFDTNDVIGGKSYKEEHFNG